MGGSITGPHVDNKSDILCIVSSGGQLHKVASILFHILSDFGAISKFATIEGSHPPTFLISYLDAKDASDTVDTLDGQYVEVNHLKPQFGALC